MADPAAPSPVTNGVRAATPADGSTTERPATVSRGQREAAERAAFLAASDDDIAADVEADATPARKPAKAPAKPAAEPEDDLDEVDADADADDADVDLDVDVDELDDAVDDLEDEVEKVAPGKEDPELAKRLAQVHRREKRVRDQAAVRDKAFEDQRNAFVTEWKPKIEAAESFEKLKARRSDPVSILKALGYSEDEFEDVSKIVYGHSKAAAADPKNKEAVARLQREREMRDRLEAVDARNAALEDKLSRQESSAAQAAEAERYMARVGKSVTAEATPLIKKRLELKPNGTRIALNKIAIELMEKAGGKLVDPKRVVALYEKRLRASRELARQLEDESLAAPAKPATKAKPAAIKVVDRTTAAPAETAADKPKNGKSLIPHRDDMIDRLRKIERGELDPDAD